MEKQHEQRHSSSPPFAGLGKRRAPSQDWCAVEECRSAEAASRHYGTPATDKSVASFWLEKLTKTSAQHSNVGAASAACRAEVPADCKNCCDTFNNTIARHRISVTATKQTSIADAGFNDAAMGATAPAAEVGATHSQSAAVKPQLLLVAQKPWTGRSDTAAAARCQASVQQCVQRAADTPNQLVKRRRPQTSTESQAKNSCRPAAAAGANTLCNSYGMQQAPEASSPGQQQQLPMSMLPSVHGSGLQPGTTLHDPAGQGQTPTVAVVHPMAMQLLWCIPPTPRAAPAAAAGTGVVEAGKPMQQLTGLAGSSFWQAAVHRRWPLAPTAQQQPNAAGAASTPSSPQPAVLTDTLTAAAAVCTSASRADIVLSVQQVLEQLQPNLRTSVGRLLSFWAVQTYGPWVNVAQLPIAALLQPQLLERQLAAVAYSGAWAVACAVACITVVLNLQAVQQVLGTVDHLGVLEVLQQYHGPLAVSVADCAAAELCTVSKPAAAGAAGVAAAALASNAGHGCSAVPVRSLQQQQQQQEQGSHGSVPCEQPCPSVADILQLLPLYQPASVAATDVQQIRTWVLQQYGTLPDSSSIKVTMLLKRMQHCAQKAASSVLFADATSPPWQSWQDGPCFCGSTDSAETAAAAPAPAADALKGVQLLPAKRCRCCEALHHMWQMPEVQNAVRQHQLLQQAPGPCQQQQQRLQEPCHQQQEQQPACLTGVGIVAIPMGCPAAPAAAPAADGGSRNLPLEQLLAEVAPGRMRTAPQAFVHALAAAGAESVICEPHCQPAAGGTPGTKQQASISNPNGTGRTTAAPAGVVAAGVVAATAAPASGTVSASAAAAAAAASKPRRGSSSSCGDESYSETSSVSTTISNLSADSLRANTADSRVAAQHSAGSVATEAASQINSAAAVPAVTGPPAAAAAAAAGSQSAAAAAATATAGPLPSLTISELQALLLSHSRRSSAPAAGSTAAGSTGCCFTAGTAAAVVSPLRDMARMQQGCHNSTGNRQVRELLTDLDAALLIGRYERGFQLRSSGRVPLQPCAAAENLRYLLQLLRLRQVQAQLGDLQLLRQLQDRLEPAAAQFDALAQQHAAELECQKFTASRLRSAAPATRGFQHVLNTAAPAVWPSGQRNAQQLAHATPQLPPPAVVAAAAAAAAGQAALSLKQLRQVLASHRWSLEGVQVSMAALRLLAKLLHLNIQDEASICVCRLLRRWSTLCDHLHQRLLLPEGSKGGIGPATAARHMKGLGKLLGLEVVAAQFEGANEVHDLQQGIAASAADFEAMQRVVLRQRNRGRAVAAAGMGVEVGSAATAAAGWRAGAAGMGSGAAAAAAVVDKEDQDVAEAALALAFLAGGGQQ